jgi:hypothetical protein
MTMTICRPSICGICSTVPTSSRSSPQLHLVIALFRPWAKLDFLDVNLLLLAPRRLRLFVLLEQVLPEIHDPADRRVGRRSHLNEVEIDFAGELNRLTQRHNPGLFSARVNDANFLGLYLFVTPCALVKCDPQILQLPTGSHAPSQAKVRERDSI